MALLKEAGIHAEGVGELDALVNALGEDVTFVVASEEAMRTANLSALHEWIEQQPAWSDLPIIVLTQRGGGPENNPSAARLRNRLGNISFLERPFHPTTFASLALTAVKARRRQFDARERIDELKESQERLATAMLAGKLGAWSYDLASGDLVTSALCRQNYGRRTDQPFSYDDLLATIHPDDVGGMRAAVAHSVATGDDYAIEYRVVWPDGTHHWTQVNGRTLSDATGATRSLVGVSMDITARKAAEIVLRESNETLEHRVAERTQELERTHAQVIEEIGQRERVEEQLRQAQKMEMIGQLTGGVAHDFNNLLMAVLSNLDLLRKQSPQDTRSLRLIDGALQGARRGAALTQRLLAFARRQSLTVQPASIPALVEGMQNLLEKSVGADIDLEYRINPNVPLAVIDGNQVELALLNLVVNARDAMPNGGKATIVVDQAEIGDTSDLERGAYVRLSVIDTGTGMDADTLEKAIEPFFSTKELGKGTGLGLSMIHGLAVQLHGALRLSSKPGEGTRADLYLPVGAAQVAAVERIEEDEPSPLKDLRARILLVDDDMLISMSTVEMLEDLGHEVIEVNSGDSALAALKRDSGIDLMITDFSMPGMNGAQLAERALNMAPGLPIILATGYAEMPAGTSINLPRLSKPYSQAQLQREIGRLLGSQPDARRE